MFCTTPSSAFWVPSTPLGNSFSSKGILLFQTKYKSNRGQNKYILRSRRNNGTSLYFFMNNKNNNSEKGSGFRGGDNNSKTQEDDKLSLSQIEQEVIASANAKVDMKRVRNAFLQSDKDEKQKLVLYTRDGSNEQQQKQKIQSPPPSQWNIAFASGSMVALVSFLLFHQPTLSAIFFIVVTYIASKDPLQEDDGLVEGDDISGPIARIVGRATITSIEKSKPKVKAVARAAIFGDEEIEVLQQRVQELEVENKEMKLWIQRRKAIDENSKFYSVPVLKDIARQNDVSLEGNKDELMMRLIEAGVLDLSSTIRTSTKK